ncbi:MAG: CoA pyrophosphatase [Chthoniobacteraceae bacterium]|nr:CoA pyrophosphatase [Chthoniobacteraceae bacterium]
MPTPTPSSEPLPLNLARIRDKLSRHTPRFLPESDGLRHAAVALILREYGAGRKQEILVIRRAEDPRDPWSGHLGFPGGRLEPSDPNPERAAVRETGEELGISLDACARRIGALSEIRARSLQQFLPLSIFPYVYELVHPAILRQNEEVATTCWVSLGFFLNRANRTTMPHPRDPKHILPCYPLGGRALWGMSLTMLDELLF